MAALLRSKTVLICLAALLAALVGFTALHKPAAPAVTFRTLDGKRVDLAALRGKVVLVNFWATDCPGCVAEMPQIRQTWQAFHDKGFEVVAVAVQYNPVAWVSRFVRDNRLPFIVAHDDSGEIARAFDNVQLTPTSYLIDAQGRILQRTIGETDFTQLRRTLASRLGARS